MKKNDIFTTVFRVKSPKNVKMGNKSHQKMNSCSVKKVLNRDISCQHECKIRENEEFEEDMKILGSVSTFPKKI